MNLIEAYRRERAPLFTVTHDTGRPVEIRQRAAQALRDARIRVAWEAAGGEEIDESEARDWDSRYLPETFGSRVRLLIRPDDISPPDDFDGSERDLEEARDRARRDGMWGVEAQFWNGAEWVDVDAVWGFIGDDWKGSGYDTDLMRAALDALAEHDAAQARAQEAERPDMYGAPH